MRLLVVDGLVPLLAVPRPRGRFVSLFPPAYSCFRLKQFFLSSSLRVPPYSLSCRISYGIVGRLPTISSGTYLPRLSVFVFDKLVAIGPNLLLPPPPLSFLVFLRPAEER